MKVILLFFLFFSVLTFPMQNQEQKTIKESRIGTAALALYHKYNGELEDIRELILTQLATSPQMIGPEAENKDFEL